MSDLADFMVHPVEVRTRTGTGSLGDTYADGVDVTVWVDEKRRLVRAADASEVISEATLHDADVTHAGLYADGSLITLPSGRVATTITTRVLTSGALQLPDHIEVAVT